MSEETAHTGPPASRPISDESTGYDPTAGTFHSRFDDGTDTVVAVVEAVSAVTNCDPTAMAPLYGTVDPEALADLVTADRDRPVEVSFDYEGCQVTVSSGGRIAVEPLAN
ncbi:HalOD1 output domain-containing protein [Haloterrigena salinisoli]|uniref:HalOD1 output domain-containing protein n=1 Tax=Haloterrigena salinisoli TaxID=3132747 RepID=UPI0030CB6323